MRRSLVLMGILLGICFFYNCASDNEAPTISITSPGDGDTVSVHTSVISAQASDNKEVEYVEFRVNNALVGTDSADPYQANWSIAGYNNMEIVSIQGNAYDAAENAGQSEVILVTVINRGMVSAATAPDDSFFILETSPTLCDIDIINAPDSAVVDSIVVHATILHMQITDVDVYLQSPAGTEHQLWNNDFNMPTDTISTTQFLNEGINGTWLVRFIDEVNNGQMGYAKNIAIEVYWKY